MVWNPRGIGAVHAKCCGVEWRYQGPAEAPTEARVISPGRRAAALRRLEAIEARYGKGAGR